MKWIVPLVVLMLGWGVASPASAQYIVQYGPVAALEPAPIVATSPFIAPAPVVAASPIIAPAPWAYRAYYPPMVVGPVVAPRIVYRAYYPPAVVAPAPVVVPGAVVAPAPIVPGAVVVRPKVYVGGQPVRNVLRAVTP